MFDIREPSIEALRAAPIKFRYTSNKRTILVDHTTAAALLAVYDQGKLSDEHKAKFERMLKHPVTLRRLVDFCWKHVTPTAA